jgi:hypothetical protein
VLPGFRPFVFPGEQGRDPLALLAAAAFGLPFLATPDLRPISAKTSDIHSGACSAMILMGVGLAMAAALSRTVQLVHNYFWPGVQNQGVAPIDVGTKKG